MSRGRGRCASEVDIRQLNPLAEDHDVKVVSSVAISVGEQGVARQLEVARIEGERRQVDLVDAAVEVEDRVLRQIG